MADYFEGYYYKHQKGSHTLCIIAGRSNSEKFIQVITEDFSVQVPFTKGNIFTSKGIKLDIQTDRLSLTGKIRYKELFSIKYDIMGPFKFFPMECRHGVISMRHRLEGQVRLNGRLIDFTDGLGYIEKDSGCSFPSSYTWIQANDFSKPLSIMAAVAEIPFCGLHFKGCICVIKYHGREYRLATYLGVRVLLCTQNRIILKQGKYRLEIRVDNYNAKQLSAPQNGEMTRVILECASCPAKFKFFVDKKLLFSAYSEHTSFEYENEDKKI